MPQNPAPIVVLGAAGFLGSEIARLSVALAHPTFGIDRRAPTSQEPWTHGVQWLRADASDLAAWTPLLTPDARLIIALGEAAASLDLSQLRRAERAGDDNAAPRIILAGPPRLTMTQRDAVACVLELPPLWGDHRSWPGADPEDPETWPAPEVAMRREQAAMAALRAALEPTHRGQLAPHQIAYLGDAMMHQSR